MKLSKTSKCSLSLVAGYCLVFVSGNIRAQDIEEPAGAIDEGYEEYSYDETGAPDESITPALQNPGAVEEIVEEKNTEVATESDSWDSVANFNSTSSIAQEITEGIRVEDIVEPPSDYRYAAFGKADPFVPPILTSAQEINAVAAFEMPIVSPLQQYRLSQLTLVGVWQLPDGLRKGMILTPSEGEAVQQGIIIKENDPIGNKGGKIIAFGEDYLTVREFLLTADGTREYQDQQIFMGSRKVEAISGTITFNPGKEETIVKVDQDPSKENAAPEGNTAEQLNELQKQFEKTLEAVEGANLQPAAAGTPTAEPGAPNVNTPAVGLPLAPNGVPEANVPVVEQIAIPAVP